MLPMIITAALALTNTSHLWIDSPSLSGPCFQPQTMTWRQNLTTSPQSMTTPCSPPGSRTLWSGTAGKNSGPPTPSGQCIGGARSRWCLRRRRWVVCVSRVLVRLVEAEAVRRGLVAAGLRWRMAAGLINR